MERTEEQKSLIESYKKKQRDYMRDYRKKNKEQLQEYQREYRKNNKDKINEAHKRYRYKLQNGIPIKKQNDNN